MASEVFDSSLFEHDAGYYEFLPGRWLPGRHVPGGTYSFPAEAVQAAATVLLDPSDVLVPTYMKTGAFLFGVEVGGPTPGRWVAEDTKTLYIGCDVAAS